jgi:L-ascorbate metabolism protein UlaG (beta-lactamase superfamily)
MITVDAQIFNQPLKEALQFPPAKGGAVFLYWLGQAGFLIQSQSNTIVIDPYLSDSLAKKCQGREFPHQRMMPSPIHPTELTKIDCIMCTHRHSDHLDPETTPVIADNNPNIKIIVPTAEKKHAASLGISETQLIAINAEQQIVLNQQISVTAIPSAHEDLKQNEAGQHFFLGYIINFPGVTIYHSGDCVPYKGLVDQLQSFKIDLALLPINGRDAYRKSRNVPGNFHLSEAIDLCLQAGIPHLIPHHFGMFDFNTIDISHTRTKIASHVGMPDIRLAEFKTKFKLTQSCPP